MSLEPSQAHVFWFIILLLHADVWALWKFQGVKCVALFSTGGVSIELFLPTSWFQTLDLSHVTQVSYHTSLGNQHHLPILELYEYPSLETWFHLNRRATLHVWVVDSLESAFLTTIIERWPNQIKLHYFMNPWERRDWNLITICKNSANEIQGNRESLEVSAFMTQITHCPLLSTCHLREAKFLLGCLSKRIVTQMNFCPCT